MTDANNVVAAQGKVRGGEGTMNDRELLEEFRTVTMRLRRARDITEEEAERAGRDCALNGPNQTNCHFSLFARPELTRAWERGKKAGDDG